MNDINEYFSPRLSRLVLRILFCSQNLFNFIPMTLIQGDLKGLSFHLVWPRLISNGHAVCRESECPNQIRTVLASLSCALTTVSKEIETFSPLFFFAFSNRRERFIVIVVQRF